ncbi:PQ-loop repeat-containing protein 3 isoform X2 [Suricata suricatta]|uniref:PQ-loop repeat-containing protein 3 isoform X2 n=1 Tax=Suricata suricatta TaxID=37032 RepID=UPI001155B100|nr:PQ-loop repeat-containing protein 3 isoform X2 [Suricata suricatta]
MEEPLLWFCNWSTLAVCAALKLPQISAVLAARSARGISLPSLLLELAGFLVFLRYQCYYEYPLLTFLEYPILIAQGGSPVHGPICGLVVRPSPAEVDHGSGHESKYFHQRGQQVCSAPVPVEEQGLGGRERPHLEPRCVHVCNKNNNNSNDHQRSYNSYAFPNHACVKRVGNRHGPSLQEDGCKG